MSFLNQFLLSTMTWLPLIATIAIVLTKSLPTVKWTAMGVAVVEFILSLYLWYAFDGTTASLQFVEQYPWLPSFGITYFLGVDGVSLLLVVLTAFLTPLILMSIWHLEKANTKGLFALIMALETGMLGALLAFDVVFFYVFWEVMLIPMYFMIGIWGGKNRIYATTKFVIYTVLGSLLMLAAAIVLYINHFEVTGVYSTNLLDLYKTAPGIEGQMWLFAAFAVAFAIKVPMWPFHTWLPDAHTEAPTVGSVVLAGVLLKMGTYGFLRFAIPLFPDALVVAAPLITALGVVGIIYGALTAWMQADAKKMVAYSSVSHLGFVVVGSVAVLGGGATLSPEALTGACYQMINHGISTGALFFLVGIIYDRRHTRMLADFGGLAKQMPWFAVMLIIATLSSVGLPGTGGFVGEFLILLGAFKANHFAGITAALGVLLGAIYMLTLCRKVLFGPLDKEENKQLKDLTPMEFGYLAPLAILAVVMGIFPNLFIGKIKSSVEFLADNFSAYELTIHQPSADSSSIAAKVIGSSLDIEGETL